MAIDQGGAKGTRTPNPLLAKQVRYQLRHGPRVLYALVGGFSPSASGRSSGAHTLLCVRCVCDQVSGTIHRV